MSAAGGGPSSGAEGAEQALRSDLAGLGERFRDDEWCADLYRALARNVWSKGDAGEGVALSFSRAEAFVNELREEAGREPFALAQTGGEGDVAMLVEEELGRLGWRARPLDTGRQDARHLEQPESPPPPDHGERMSPAEDSDEWERRAHELADEGRLGRRSP